MTIDVKITQNPSMISVDHHAYDFTYNDYALVSGDEFRERTTNAWKFDYDLRYAAFEFCYSDNGNTKNSLTEFNDFLAYIHNPKTDTVDCFDPSRIFFHNVVRNDIILGKSRSGSGSFNLPLVEFLYITVDPDFTKHYCSGEIIFKGFFAIRTLFGLCAPSTLRWIANNVRDQFDPELKVWILNGTDAVRSHWDYLMAPATYNPQYGLAHTAAFHAFHWFRNYNKCLHNAGACWHLFLFIDHIWKSRGFVPFAYTSYIPCWSPSDASSLPYPEDIDIDLNSLGIKRIPNFYEDRVNLLLGFLRQYVSDKRISVTKTGLWYRNVNGVFITELGSSEWFRNNLYEIIMEALKKPYNIGYRSIDLDHLVEAQLDSVIKLITAHPEFLTMGIRELSNKWSESERAVLFNS